MPKHYASKKAKCPFYKRESRQVIYCEGIKEGTVLHLAFANPSDCLQHKKTFCQCNYNQCSLNNLLLSKYNNL